MSSNSSKRRRLDVDDVYEDPDDLEQTPRPKTRRREHAAAPLAGLVSEDATLNALATPRPITTNTTGPPATRYSHALSESANTLSHPFSTQSPLATSSHSKFGAASLERLSRPVRIRKSHKMGAELPGDTRKLFRELSSVKHLVKILPRYLEGCAELDTEVIQDHMWMDDAARHDGATEEHRWLMTILADAVESANLYRAESAWNNIVHYPLLRGLVSKGGRDSLRVEPVANAQIAPAFRPKWENSTGQWTSTPSSLASSSRDGSQAASDSPSKSAKVSGPAHRMVDFTLALNVDSGDDGLAAAVDRFLGAQPPALATINQTLYVPLKRRPAPVFIETKTDSGNADTANAQLGVWLAAWYERIHSIFQIKRLHQQSCPDRVITLPLIQVIGGTWKVLFAVDRGHEVEILDGDMHIGSTNTAVGLYQLQAAILSICRWMQEDFRPWFLDLLQE